MIPPRTGAIPTRIPLIGSRFPYVTVPSFIEYPLGVEVTDGIMENFFTGRKRSSALIRWHAS